MDVALYAMASGFLSTPSARRATLVRLIHIVFQIDFYPRPPRGGRPLCRVRHQATPLHFYPRPPRGGRPAARAASMSQRLFLSTPSARRATTTAKRLSPSTNYFYPRPPRGGRPHDGGRSAFFKKFLSTPSARRATFCPGHPLAPPAISIHALREEGDFVFTPMLNPPELFLSTPSARRATLQ